MLLSYLWYENGNVRWTLPNRIQFTVNITWSSASAFSLTTEGLGLVGRGNELVLDAPVL
jgi:hypothetical protein